MEFDYHILKIPVIFQRFSKPIGIFISIGIVCFLGVTDYLTGNELSFSIFYLIPISFSTLFAGRKAGLIVSLISAIIWFYADLLGNQKYSNPLIPYWNSLVRLGYFTLHTFILSILLTLNENLKKIMADNGLFEFNPRTPSFLPMYEHHDKSKGRIKPQRQDFLIVLYPRCNNFWIKK